MNPCEIASSLDDRFFFQKEAGASQICVDESYFTCLLWAEILGNAGLYAGSTVDALEKANSSRKEVYKESHDPARHFLNRVLSRPVF